MQNGKRKIRTETEKRGKEKNISRFAFFVLGKAEIRRNVKRKTAPDK